jgi:hypothetical protein
MKKTRRLSLLVGMLFVLSVISTACAGAGTGAPSSPGNYDVQKNSVRFDGERYNLFWADQSGGLHEMQTRKLRLVRDQEKTYLEVTGGGDPILHLKEDEPITVEGQDRQGGFSSSWFPFLLGTAIGSQFGGRGGGPIIINQPAPGERGSYGANTPAYRYPPTGTFGRDEDLHGSLDSSKPQPPDYARVQPQPYATSGKSSGTGGGTAASNKSPSSPGQQAGAPNAASGQSGGTGGGSAASDKGGFRSGDQSFSNRSSGSSGVGAGSSGTGSGGSTANKPSTGVSGSKGIGGSGSSGSKGIGGARSGGGGRR